MGPTKLDAQRPKQIAQAETARRAAMVAGDCAALEALIDPDALYVHTNSMVDTGLSFIEAVRRGAYRYREVTQPEIAIRMLGDAALVTGRTILHAELADGTKSFVDARSVVVWFHRDGAWRLVHYQGTLLRP